MVSFWCRNCGKIIEIDDEYAGKKCRCPYCENIMTVPVSRSVDRVEKSAVIPAPAPKPPEPHPKSPPTTPIEHSACMIDVCGPEDQPPEGALKLAVASHAPSLNPTGWRDLWRLSPLSVVGDGLAVPGLAGVTSKTMENAWQFLKIWDFEEVWDSETAAAAFEADCAMRYPRGRQQKAVGHYWGETGETLDYVEARKRIYLPAYCQLLNQPDRQELIQRLRDAAHTQPIVIWDYDSYSISDLGLQSFSDTLTCTSRRFAHAFIVAMAVNGQLPKFIEDVSTGPSA